MPTAARDLPDSSVIFHNRTNSENQEKIHGFTGEKEVDGAAPPADPAHLSTKPLFVASSSLSDIRSPRSPSIEGTVSDRDQFQPSEAMQSSTTQLQPDWIPYTPSNDTSSWIPSASTQSSGADSTGIVSKTRYITSPTGQISSTIPNSEASHSRTSTRSGDTGIATTALASDDAVSSTLTNQTDQLFPAAPSSKHSFSSSDPLGLFSSSSYIPSSSSSNLTSSSTAGSSGSSLSLSEQSKTSVSHASRGNPLLFAPPGPPLPVKERPVRSAATLDINPLLLPSARASLLSSITRGTYRGEGDERPSKRQRRQPVESSLPPSDPECSPLTVGTTNTPSLPAFSSPNLQVLGNHSRASQPSRSSGFIGDVPQLAPGSTSSGLIVEVVSRPPERLSSRLRIPRSDTLSTFSQSTASTRRSARNIQYFPLGPRHLEYDYHVAHEELREATILAVHALQKQWPKRKHRLGRQGRGEREAEEEAARPTLEMILAAKFPYVEKARRMVNEADKRLQEALNRGETWENTPVPAHLLTPTYEDLDQPSAATSQTSSRRQTPESQAGRSEHSSMNQKATTVQKTKHKFVKRQRGTATPDVDERHDN